MELSSRWHAKLFDYESLLCVDLNEDLRKGQEWHPFFAFGIFYDQGLVKKDRADGLVPITIEKIMTTLAIRGMRPY